MKIRVIWYVHLYIGFVRPDLELRQDTRRRPPQEVEHHPSRYNKTYLDTHILGEKVPDYYESPDFRVEEPFFMPYVQKHMEVHRPYRMSPHYKGTIARWRYRDENLANANCYCCTVYKRLTPLATCAIITTRHLLTTATSTHLIMKGRYHYGHLEGILGAWYETSHNVHNASMYLTPAAIFYHPYWHYPEDVNRSHPFSFTFDLSVWTFTHNIYGWYLNWNSAKVCLRATSHARDQYPPIPSNEMFIVIGYQFMWAYKRKPMPWFRYGIRTMATVNPCPKTEWGWFLCINADYLRYGIESGTILHRAFHGVNWRWDGLVGMGVFSTNLRTVNMLHYFTILDTHVVLEFLFDCYRRYQLPIFRDKRFNHVIGFAAEPNGSFYIPYYHQMGENWYYDPWFDK